MLHQWEEGKSFYIFSYLFEKNNLQYRFVAFRLPFQAPLSTMLKM